MSRRRIDGAAVPSRVNLAAVSGVVAACLALFFGVPLLLAQGHGWAAWLLVPLVLTIVPHWALIHEAVHGHLLPGPRGNELLGRVLAVLFLSPFDTLRFGHLSHHALNAKVAERPEYYDPRLRSRVRAVLVFYGRLLFGVGLLETASCLLALLPRRVLRPIVRQIFYEHEPEAARMAGRAERMLLAPGTLRQIRIGGLTAMLVLGTSLLAYGTAWPLLAMALLGRAMLISILDNAPHYEGALEQPDQGFDMHLPGGLGGLVLNTNLHGTHHRHPNLPWAALPAAFAADRAEFVGSYLTVPWRQLRGPVPITPFVGRH